MESICVIYNSFLNKIFISEKNGIHTFPKVDFINEGYNINKVIKFLKNDYLLSTSKEEFTEIFSNKQQVILLVTTEKNIDSSGIWIPVNQLQSINVNKTNYLKYILNYFFRMDRLKPKPLLIYLECSDSGILEKCKEYIFQRNSGISNNYSKNNLGLVILEHYHKDAKIISILLDDTQEEYTTSSIEEKVRVFNGEPILEIYNKIIMVITKIYSKYVSENISYLPSCFLGITGLTESGKSYYAKYIDSNHDIWNLKIRSFIENSKYLIDEEILLLKEVVSIKLMLDFACYHYFKKAFVIESVYSKHFHNSLQNILKEKYKLIYLDVSQDVRLKRSLDSKVEFKKKELKKYKLEVNLLMKEADYLVDNSGSIFNTQRAIDRILANF
ncbi:TPA: hypothetical protein QFH18_002568 [Enterococcus faecium]|nr:hypothetical protein [Enterococcus faecium]